MHLFPIWNMFFLVLRTAMGRAPASGSLCTRPHSKRLLAAHGSARSGGVPIGHGTRAFHSPGGAWPHGAEFQERTELPFARDGERSRRLSAPVDLPHCGERRFDVAPEPVRVEKR